MKLSDAQLMILSSASQRTNHAAVLPANLKGSAAKKVVNRLLNEKLLQELRAKDDMPVWRRGDDNRPYSLRITKAGLKAIEVEDVAEAPDNDAAADPDEVATADMSTEAKSSERPSRAKQSGAKKTAAVSAKATRASTDRVKADSKQDYLNNDRTRHRPDSVAKAYCLVACEPVHMARSPAEIAFPAETNFRWAERSGNEQDPQQPVDTTRG
jgi:hypothetical protein